MEWKSLSGNSSFNASYDMSFIFKCGAQIGDVCLGGMEPLVKLFIFEKTGKYNSQ
jgi:hypothetical protein